MKLSKLKIKKYVLVAFFVALLIFCLFYCYCYCYWLYPHSNNIVTFLPNFLSHDECDRIIQLSNETGLTPSHVYNVENKENDNTNSNDKIDTSHRKSSQTFLDDTIDPLIQAISNKCSEMLQIPMENAESLQVVKYDKSDYFNKHYDALCQDKTKSGINPHCRNDRYATILIYLNDDFIGGETYFPELNISVTPKKGNAILFYNTTRVTRELLTKSIHAGKPIQDGTKWICNKWFRHEKYEPE